MSELSIQELESQHGELLPEREALGVFAVHISSVHVHQFAEALQALNVNSTNIAANASSVWA